MSKIFSIKRWMIVCFVIVICSCFSMGDFVYDLPNNYIIYSPWSTKLTISSKVNRDEEYNIPSYVYSVGWDEVYVYAKQHPIKEYSDGKEEIDRSVTNYWLMNTRDERMKIGPLTKRDFLEKCKALGLDAIYFIDSTSLSGKKNVSSSSEIKGFFVEHTIYNIIDNYLR